MTSDPATTAAQITKLVDFYQNLSPESVALCAHFYNANAEFRDPFNNVRGVAAISKIFSHMYKQLDTPVFSVTHRMVGSGEAVLWWQLDFFWRRGFNKRVAHRIEGVSHIELDHEGLVKKHRDYWDSGEELFQHLPVVGLITKGLQKLLRA